MVTDPDERPLPPPPDAGGAPEDEVPFVPPYPVRVGHDAEIGWPRRTASGALLVTYLVVLGALAALLIAVVVVIVGVLISGSLN